MGTDGPLVVWGRRTLFVTRSLVSREMRENAPFKTNYSKKLLQHSVQGLLKKIVLRNKDIVFCWNCLVHTRSLQSLVVNERLNGRKDGNVNGKSRTLRTPMTDLLG